MFRFLTIVLFLIIFFIASIPIQLVLLIIGLFSMNARNKISLAIVKWGFKVTWHIAGLKLTVNGYENIPQDQSVLFIGNHTGMFDIVTTYPLMKKPTGYVAKDSIKKVPGLSWWMYFVNCIFLNREDPREGLKSILKASDYIKNGISIFLFPEGTRSKDGKLHEFKDGGFKIATKVGAPIIPVGIKGSSAMFEDQFPKVKPGHITINFGKPIYTSEFSRTELKSVPNLVRQEVAKLSGQECV